MEEFLNKIKENFINTDVEFETINIKVDSSQWVDTHQKLKEEFDLKFFSWLSAIDLSLIHI